MCACANCGGVVKLTESNGGTKEGHFTEIHECINCDATGRISGDAGDMAENWNRYGAVFEGGL